MPNKVLAGTGTMKAAGTVIKKLNKRLVERGYRQADEAVTDRLKELGRDLGSSQDPCDRLYESILENKPAKYGETDRGPFRDLPSRSPGEIWLEPIMTGSVTIGPVPVPKGISKSCKAGWDIGGAVREDCERVASRRGLERLPVSTAKVPIA